MTADAAHPEKPPEPDWRDHPLHNVIVEILLTNPIPDEYAGQAAGDIADKIMDAFAAGQRAAPQQGGEDLAELLKTFCGKMLTAIEAIGKDKPIPSECRADVQMLFAAIKGIITTGRYLTEHRDALARVATLEASLRESEARETALRERVVHLELILESAGVFSDE